jgi:hypothetical protein
MARQKSADELETLRQQHIELAKRIKQAEVKQRQKDKADDARRYLLAGTAALDHMKAEPDTAFASTLLGLIDARAKGAADRALFGLPRQPEPAGTNPCNPRVRSNPYEEESI